MERYYENKIVSYTIIERASEMHDTKDRLCDNHNTSRSDR